MLDRTRSAIAFARSLPRFLATTLAPGDARAMVERQLGRRGDALVKILARAVYARPNGVYARLLARAGMGLERVAALIEQLGAEGALARLHDAGVYLTLEEFKGRRAIRRGDLEIRASEQEFDNPLLAASYEAVSGGSRGAGTRVLIDLDLLAYEAAHQSLFATTFGFLDSPAGQWRPVPPAVAGINNALRSARIGRPIERWFSQTDPAVRAAGLGAALLLRFVVLAGRRRGGAIARPEHVPVAEAEHVAQWLAARRSSGRPVLLDTTSSAATRVCTAAARVGLDVSGSVFRVGGEPWTPARASTIRAAGAVGLVRYSMAEVGTIGVACAHPREVDEVHLLSDKLAVVQRERSVGGEGRRVGALLLTTLLPSSPKLLLNVESDDYGTLDKYRCGCAFESLGLDRHAHTIRSFEKLTSEGMSFIGADLLQLIDEVLPARFGGDPTRYQFVEEEEIQGLPKVELRIDASIGPLDERAVVETVLSTLAKVSSAHRMMAESWRRAGTLQVVRAAPLATRAAKILPLHIRRTSA